MNYNYIPDSVYTVCGSETNDCHICSNVEMTQFGYVHDTLRGKVFCPFGKKGSMNQSIFKDQQVLNQNINLNTTWGRAPQLDPRPLAKIGLSFLN